MLGARAVASSVRMGNPRSLYRQMLRIFRWADLSLRCQKGAADTLYLVSMERNGNNFNRILPAVAVMAP